MFQLKSILKLNAAWVLAVAPVVLIFVAVGCEKKGPGGDGGTGGDGGDGDGGGTAAAPETDKQPAASDPSQWTAKITGVVKIEGNVPTMPPVNMSQKPDCVKLHGDQKPLQDNIRAGDGGAFRDVVVTVKKGLEAYSFDSPDDPAVIDQKGCRYEPHVFAIMVGQDLNILNSDPLLHNVNVTQNRAFNVAMNQKGQVITKKSWFKKPGVVDFKCEVHPWMKAYAYVSKHPKTAVTGTDGKFEISGLPAGKYTVGCWHELFPNLKPPADQEIELKAGESKTIEFVYKI